MPCSGQSSSRLRLDGSPLRFVNELPLFKNIPLAVNRYNVTRVPDILLDLSAQMGYIHMNVIHTSLVLVAPYVSKDLVEGQQLAAIARQIDQQAKLDGGQFETVPVDQDLMPFNVDT